MLLVGKAGFVRKDERGLILESLQVQLGSREFLGGPISIGFGRLLAVTIIGGFSKAARRSVRVVIVAR